jgi:hypothetical protein
MLGFVDKFMMRAARGHQFKTIPLKSINNITAIPKHSVLRVMLNASEILQ